ncbi:MAG: diacylglycerol/lipid kinase family protein [Chloroflexota bacterium]
MTSLSDTLRRSAPAAGRPSPLTGEPATLIYNPNAGAKLGLSTNAADPDAVQAALQLAKVPYDPRPTERVGHATELARVAVAEGRKLVIAAGGDGTVGEVAQALVGAETTLGVMPLGSVMNVARTLHIPRDLEAAARVIASGRTLAIDVGKTGDTYFLEAAGVGLDAGLFRFFNRLDRGVPKLDVAKAAWRFLRGLGVPRLVIDADGDRRHVRAPMVTVANSPFLGAAYAIAPEARIDDGLLDVVIFRRLSAVHVLVYLLMVAGGRPFPRPRGVETLRVRSIDVNTRRRPLPAHADGELLGTTPAHFEVAPRALRVIVGTPEQGQQPAWEVLSDAPS